MKGGRPGGDRVAIGMTGKFLPYKYYGATGNALAYGLALLKSGILVSI